MYPLATHEAADLFDDIVNDPANDFNSVASRIPGLFGVSTKATYLCYRSLGLSTQQTLLAMAAPDSLLEIWERDDPDFLAWEARNIWQLQNTLAADIIKLGFMKNMARMIAIDSSIIAKAMFNMEALPKTEKEYLMKIRGHYTPSDLLALDKVMHPGDYRPEVNVILSWGNEKVFIEGVQGDENPDFLMHQQQNTLRLPNGTVVALADEGNTGGYDDYSSKGHDRN